MRKFFAIAVMLLLAASLMAQEKEKQADKHDVFSFLSSGYRLDFALKELDAGKVINTREYTMMMMASNQRGGQGFNYGEVKAGNRVPIMVEKGPQYIDVGINISANLYQLDSGALMLTSTTEVSSLASGGPGPAAAPVLRSSKANSIVEVPAGKPTLLSSVDDPVSNHRFQLEVTVSKLK